MMPLLLIKKKWMIVKSMRGKCCFFFKLAALRTISNICFDRRLLRSRYRDVQFFAICIDAIVSPRPVSIYMTPSPRYNENSEKFSFFHSILIYHLFYKSLLRSGLQCVALELPYVRIVEFLVFK